MAQTEDLPWMELDPAKADLKATHGAYIAGSTLLQLSPNHVVVVGLISCTTREDAERHARECPRNVYPNHLEFDRRVTRKVLLSWKKEA